MTSTAARPLARLLDAARGPLGPRIEAQPVDGLRPLRGPDSPDLDDEYGHKRAQQWHA